MKIKRILLLFVAGAALLSACTKASRETPLPAEAGYVGKLDVIEIADELFHMDDIRASYVLNADGKLDISLYEVSFSSRMPVVLSVVVLQDVGYVRDGSKLSLSDTDIIPMMEMRGELVPYERYLCTDLTGEVTPGQMKLSMKLGGFQTDYLGDYKE